MLKKSRRPLLKNEDGLASLEVIPVMIVIAVLINFSLGFFGVIHTGILTQIAARNYAFETFRHRSSLMYFHDVRGGTSNFAGFNTRAHSIASDKRGASSKAAIATLRSIGFGYAPDDRDGGNQVHEGGGNGQNIMSINEGQRNENIDASPVWIRPVYGVCLTMSCRKQ